MRACLHAVAPLLQVHSYVRAQLRADHHTLPAVAQCRPSCWLRAHAAQPLEYSRATKSSRALLILSQARALDGCSSLFSLIQSLPLLTMAGLCVRRDIRLSGWRVVIYESHGFVPTTEFTRITKTCKKCCLCVLAPARLIPGASFRAKDRDERS